ncbi:MAG: hypothetical protein ACKVKL_15365 [Pseudomonadales bacterium]|jgi:hypothetical protein|tara:strand:+ start:63 stop:296 length:234 start_codon:yes stop_codon:yes gene_type:complete
MIVAIGLFNRQRDIVNIIVKKQIITNRSVRSAAKSRQLENGPALAIEAESGAQNLYTVMPGRAESSLCSRGGSYVDL